MSCLLVEALWWPAWRGLTSWLSYVLCFLVFFCHIPIWCSGSGMVLYCIDSWSLPYSLLRRHAYKYNEHGECIKLEIFECAIKEVFTYLVSSSEYTVSSEPLLYAYSKTCCKRPHKKMTKNWFSKTIIASCRSNVLQNFPRGAFCKTVDLPCRSKVLQNAPRRTALCNTFDLHLANSCH